MQRYSCWIEAMAHAHCAVQSPRLREFGPSQCTYNVVDSRSGPLLGRISSMKGVVDSENALNYTLSRLFCLLVLFIYLISVLFYFSVSVVPIDFFRDLLLRQYLLIA